jgi:hypothetical protein
VVRTIADLTGELERLAEREDVDVTVHAEADGMLLEAVRGLAETAGCASDGERLVAAYLRATGQTEPQDVVAGSHTEPLPLDDSSPLDG